MKMETIKAMFSSMRDLSEKYEEASQDVSDAGFNVFKIASDFYYRENFHSYIIKALLDPTEKHKQGNAYLNTFIDMLCLCTNVRLKNIVISRADFENSKVCREENRIDILILNEKSKKAIIIENKINNAKDMERQLPRYYEEVVKKGYSVEAIVYITLDKTKKPDQSNWKGQDDDNVNERLIIIPAYSRDKSINLFDNWITPSIMKSNDIDSAFLLRQYGNLLKNLNTTAMDNENLKEFYETLQKEKNLQTAISIRDMLNDLPKYLATRVEERFSSKCEPFTLVWITKDRNLTVFEGFKTDDLIKNEDIGFKINVRCAIDSYIVEFLIWVEEEQANELTPNELTDIETFDIKAYCPEMLQDFTAHEGKINHISKKFSIFDENILFDFIDKFLVSLKSKEV